MRNFITLLLASMIFVASVAKAETNEELCHKTVTAVIDQSSAPVSPNAVTHIKRIATLVTEVSFLKINVVVRKGVPDAAFCDGTILINEDSANASDSELLFKIAHEAAHIDLGHDFDRLNMLKAHLKRMPTVQEEMTGISMPAHLIQKVRQFELAADRYAAQLVKVYGGDLGEVASSLSNLVEDEYHPSGDERARRILNL